MTTLKGYVNYDGDGLTISTRAMNTQVALLNVHTDNIANFGIPGYQKKTPVLTSFAEYLGPNAIEKTTDTSSGRLRKSGNPLDFALNTQGYFQKLNALGGVEQTRDGRFHLDADGTLRALDGKQILGANGKPLRLASIPKDPEKQVKVDDHGNITVYDDKHEQTVAAGRIGVVGEKGAPLALTHVDLKQGYVEDSNVMLQEEFVAVMPLRRQFEANRQMFIMQSDALSRMIQELGRAQ